MTQPTPSSGISEDAGRRVADDALLTPGEVAELFRVSPKTVSRWSKAGRLTAFKTLGGHRRFRAGEVREVLEKALTEEVRSR